MKPDRDFKADNRDVQFDKYIIIQIQDYKFKKSNMDIKV